MKKRVNLVQVDKIEYTGRNGEPIKQYKYVFLEKGKAQLLELYSYQEEGELFQEEKRTYNHEVWNEDAAFDVEVVLKTFNGKPSFSLLHQK